MDVEKKLDDHHLYKGEASISAAVGKTPDTQQELVSMYIAEQRILPGSLQ